LGMTSLISASLWSLWSAPGPAPVFLATMAATGIVATIIYMAGHLAN
jgi:hypothetical protein